MKKSDVCCEHAVKPGQKLKLRTFKDKKLKVFGKVEYISNNFNPLKYDCPNHNLPDGNVNIWLWCEKSNEGGNTSDAFLGRNEKKCFASKYVAMYIYILVVGHHSQ